MGDSSTKATTNHRQQWQCVQVWEQVLEPEFKGAGARTQWPTAYEKAASVTQRTISQPGNDSTTSASLNKSNAYNDIFFLDSTAFAATLLALA